MIVTNELNLDASGLLTTRQAATVLGTTPAYVRRLRRMGLLKSWKIEGTGIRGGLLFLRADVEKYRDSHPALGSITGR